MKIQFLKENIEQNLQDYHSDKNKIKTLLEICKNSNINKKIIYCI